MTVAAKYNHGGRRYREPDWRIDLLTWHPAAAFHVDGAEFGGHGQWNQRALFFAQRRRLLLAWQSTASRFSSWHPRRAQFLLADGSGRFLSETTNRAALEAFCTRRDGEPLGNL